MAWTASNRALYHPIGSILLYDESQERTFKRGRRRTEHRHPPFCQRIAGARFGRDPSARFGTKADRCGCHRRQTAVARVSSLQEKRREGGRRGEGVQSVHAAACISRHTHDTTPSARDAFFFLLCAACFEEHAYPGRSILVINCSLITPIVVFLTPPSEPKGCAPVASAYCIRTHERPPAPCVGPPEIPDSSPSLPLSHHFFFYRARGSLRQFGKRAIARLVSLGSSVTVL